MRIFAISDIHVDFEENRRWVNSLSLSDYKNDVLILAGDVTDDIVLLEKTFTTLKKCFKEILYVTGNHDLWVYRFRGVDSIKKFDLIKSVATRCGVRMEPVKFEGLSIIPLFGWYDYSFGKPSDTLFDSWADFVACEWPSGFDQTAITNYFTSINENFLDITNKFIISFSHFLPRIDIMPYYIPDSKRTLYPVLGSSLLETQIRKLGSNIHVYGHSHVNLRITMDNTLYINNAFGYPYELRITAKELKCIYEM